jgi:hypothetical protein
MERLPVFHNADLYPPDYASVRAITWRATERPVTIPERLVALGGAHRVERVALFGVSELPLGKELRAGLRGFVNRAGRLI